MELDSRLELIRSLIPLGLMAVCEELEREVVSLAGARHSRKPEDPRHYRHGTNPGTVRLAGQRVPVEVPRVRGPEGELRLQSYDELHRGGELNEIFFRRVLDGSCVATTSGRQRRFPVRSGCRVHRCRASSLRQARPSCASFRSGI